MGVVVATLGVLVGNSDGISDGKELGTSEGRLEGTCVIGFTGVLVG